MKWSLIVLAYYGVPQWGRGHFVAPQGQYLKARAMEGISREIFNLRRRKGTFLVKDSLWIIMDCGDWEDKMLSWWMFSCFRVEWCIDKAYSLFPISPWLSMASLSMACHLFWCLAGRLTFWHTFFKNYISPKVSVNKDKPLCMQVQKEILKQWIIKPLGLVKDTPNVCPMSSVQWTQNNISYQY